jgi:hypothetical protein
MCPWSSRRGHRCSLVVGLLSASVISKGNWSSLRQRRQRKLRLLLLPLRMRRKG